MRTKIVEALRRIEEKEGVKIIYACESGSRAWGFASEDSDYDVRFIYVRPQDWYLSVDERKDIIEVPVDDNLDINGWDLRKSLSLLRKSNSVILEWLASPIQYFNHALYVPFLTGLSQKAFLPRSSCRHYLGMAKSSLGACQTEEKVKTKSYLYAIRPVLCCRWIVRFGKQAPMPIDDLIAEFLPDQKDGLRQYMDHIIRIKKGRNEGDRIDRSPEFENYLQVQLEELETLLPENPPELPMEEFDRVFRTIVKSTSIPSNECSP
jgi:uncharacterized protein